MKKTRKRIEGEIERLSNVDLSSAVELAHIGRKRSDIQRAVFHYLQTCEIIGKAPKSERAELDAAFPNALENSAARLNQLFQRAVETHDVEQLREVADEVERFRSDARKGFPIHTPQDTKRAWLVFVKKLLIRDRTKVDVPTLAKWAKAHGIHSSNEDGHRELRRLAERVGVPLRHVSTCRKLQGK